MKTHQIINGKMYDIPEIGEQIYIREGSRNDKKSVDILAIGTRLSNSYYRLYVSVHIFDKKFDFAKDFSKLYQCRSMIDIASWIDFWLNI